MLRARIAVWCRIAGRMLHVYWQILCGAWRVSALQQPVVSVFGSSHVRQDDNYAQQAMQLAHRFSEAGISVLTGGGPGIMEAVSCAIMPPYTPGKGKTIGIGVRDLGERYNPCAHEYIELDYFFARKWLLTRFSVAIVVFPGGFGTLDELFELLTLIQTKKGAQVPVVLVGKEYWQELLAWLTGELLRREFIQERDLEIFTVTDDLEAVFCLVRNECAVSKVRLH